MAKKLDWEQAKKIIETEKSRGLVRVAAGLEDADMSWANIWVDGQYVNPRKNPQYPGFFASMWDTPMIKLVFKDGTYKELPCFVTQPTVTLSDAKCPEWWEQSEVKEAGNQ